MEAQGGKACLAGSPADDRSWGNPTWVRRRQQDRVVNQNQVMAMSSRIPPPARPLVTESDVRAVPVGGHLSVPPGALVTPLARQIALERHVALEEVRATPPLRQAHLREEIVRIGRLMYQKGFVAATEGNISARLDQARVLATASGRPKGFLTPDELIMVDMEGRPVRPLGDLRPTSEMPMHLEIYRERPDVSAVVHAHPPIAVALSIAGVSLEEPLQPEAVVRLGAIPTAEYATPGTPETVAAIRDLVGRYDAILLRRHGVVTVGVDPFDAYTKMEIVEQTAHVALLVKLLGRGQPLPAEQVEKLLALRQRLGLRLPGEAGYSGPGGQISPPRDSFPT